MKTIIRYIIRYITFEESLILENIAIGKKLTAVTVTLSPEMYLRFCGVSLRYFACVSLNSTEKESIYDKSRNVGGDERKVEIQRDVCCEVDFSIAR